MDKERAAAMRHEAGVLGGRFRGLLTDMQDFYDRWFAGHGVPLKYHKGWKESNKQPDSSLSTRAIVAIFVWGAVIYSTTLFT